MKICMLCYRGNPYSGGQGIYLKYAAEALVRQGHEVHAIVGPPYPDPMKGVIVHRLPNNQYHVKKKRAVINPSDPFEIFQPLNFYEYLSTRYRAFSEINAFSFRAYWKLRELLRDIRFDVIHDNQCLGYGFLLMKTLGVPLISTIHHPLTIDLENVLERTPGFIDKARWVSFYPIVMQKIVSKRLDHVITVSEDSKKRINTDFGVPLKRQTVVYNGLDTNIFRKLRGVKKKKGKIIFVGNVEDGKKGFLYLARAMREVKPGVRLTVVDGGAPHRRVTSQLITSLGIGDRIEFTGKVDTETLVRHYNEAECAIVPSVYEGFGFPAAEAMACGVPVIASDGGALPEVVGETGVVVPSRDADALAVAINGLMADAKRRKMFGEAGMIRVMEEFNWDRAAERMVEVYEKFL